MIKKFYPPPYPNYTCPTHGKVYEEEVFRYSKDHVFCLKCLHDFEEKERIEKITKICKEVVVQQ